MVSATLPVPLDILASNGYECMQIQDRAHIVTATVQHCTSSLSARYNLRKQQSVQTRCGV